MNIGSAFSGVGGFDLGLERAGHEIKFQCEVDAHRRKLLAQHWPGTPLSDDIKALDAEWLRSNGIRPSEWSGPASDLNGGGADNLQGSGGSDSALAKIDLFCGGFPCFVAGTLVETSTGLVPIENIVVGDQVLTHERRFRPVVQTMVKKNAPTLTVQAMGAPSTQTTAEHPFYVRRLLPGRPRKWSDPEWLPAKELGKDCFVAMPLGSPKEEINPALAYLIGRWLGDGWIVDHKRTSKIPQGKRGSRVNSQAWKAIICCSEEEDGELAAAIKAAGFHATRASERTVVKFHISSKELVQQLAPFGRGASGKHLPSDVHQWSLKAQSALLKGWIDADSGVTVSKALAVGMAKVARTVNGLAVSISHTTPPATTVIEGRVVNQRPWWRVRIPPSNREAFVEDGFAWCPVRTVTPAQGRSVVYNIGVKEDESYTAEGTVVHNCQDLSVAGRRRGLIDGERSNLFFEAIRVADLVLGDGGWLLIENVPGLFSSNDGRDFAIVLASLAELGFHDCAWRVLDSRYVRVSSRPAVAQRRRRVFILARRARGRRSAEVLLEPESGGGDFATSRQARPRVAATLSKGSSSSGSKPGRRQEDDINIVSTLQGGSGKRGHRVDAEGAAGGHIVAGTLTRRQGKGPGSDVPTGHVVTGTVRSHPRPGSNSDGGVVAHTLTSGGFDASEDGSGRGTPIVAAEVDPDRDREASGVSGGVDRAAAREDLTEVSAPVTKKWAKGSGGPAGDEVQNLTVQAFAQNSRDELRFLGEKGAGDHVGALAAQPGMKQQSYLLVEQESGPQSDRCAVDPIPDGVRYAAMGDAVTVNVAEWIGRRLNQYGGE